MTTIASSIGKLTSKDNICAICRYKLTPMHISYCSSCNNSDKLWLCFTCGFLGCGDELPMIGCIYKHYENTSHAYCKPVFE